MGGLTSLAWRSLVARRGRTILSIIAIGLGVGVLFASIATDAGIAASIDRTVREIVGRADLRVSAFQDRGLSPASVAAITGAPGVTVAAPVLERRIYLEPEPLDPTPVPDGSLPDPVTLIAIDPELDAAIRDLPIAAGTGLAGNEEFAVLVSERLALEDGLSVGGDVSILAGADGPVPLRIAGLIEGDGPFVGSAGRTVIIPIQTAQRLLGEEGVSRVDIVVGEGASPDEVEDALEVALTSEPYVLSSPREVASALSVSTADFRSTTALIGAVSLFVGAFLIFNTLSMTVVERVRELGLLRAAGTSRDQVSRFVLFQAAVLGVAGALLGLLIGYVLAELMAAYVRSIGAVPFERVDLDPGTALLAAGIGLFVTLAASIEPARRAGSISPVEALKARLDPVAARRARLRWLVGVFVAVGFAGLVVWPRDTGGAGLVRAIAVYGLLLLVVLLSPFLLASLARFAGLPFATFLRLEERLARAALARDRSRTALTVGALTVGLAMVVAVGGLSGQSRSAASTWLADVIPGDELVTSIRPIDLVAEAQTVESLRDVEGVARVSPIALFEVAREGVRTDAAAVVGADLRDDGRLRIIGGNRDAALTAIDDGPATIVPRSLAERDGLSVGSEVVLAIGGERVVRLEIVGVAEHTLPGRVGEALLVGWETATAELGVVGAEVFAIRYEPGLRSAARPELEAAATLAALETNPLEQVAGAVDAALGRVFGLFDALAIVAVLVAGLGIVNTLTMNVLERFREFGVLRAAGMTTRQMRRTVVVEAGILGVIGTILGVLAGLAAGALVVLMSGSRVSIAAGLPWGSIALAALLGIGLSMLASWYPARLASRLAIVHAVRQE